MADIEKINQSNFSQIAVIAEPLMQQLRELIENTRKRVASVVSDETTQLYWNVGNAVNTFVLQGSMVVFSAAQGDETAYPNKDKQHGMLTYFRLKKLQDTKGNVTLQELGSVITSNVKQQPIVKNGKTQTSCVTSAASVADSWQNWKLK